MRHSVYSRLAGDEDFIDADRLAFAPAMRHVVGGRAALPEKQAASTSEVGRFETELLSTQSNLTAIIHLSGRWIDKVHERKPLKELSLDLGVEIEVPGGEGLCRTSVGC